MLSTWPDLVGIGKVSDRNTERSSKLLTELIETVKKKNFIMVQTPKMSTVSGKPDHSNQIIFNGNSIGTILCPKLF